MKTLLRLGGLFLAPILSLPAGTMIVMTPEILNGFAAPPQSYVTITTGSTVLLATAEAVTGSATAVQWSKDGVAIPGATAGILTLANTTAADSGLYQVSPSSSNGGLTGYVGIHLDVAARGRLGNTSSRLTLKAGSDIQIFGFVVNGTQPKSVLIRGVGPSLAPLGVPTPAAQPRLKLYNAQGQSIDTTPASTPDWTALFVAAGAFPLSGGEDPDQTCIVKSLPPGAYTVHISDATAQGGNVLVEVYELP